MDAEDGTVPLDETFTETIEHYGRSYQHYSLTNGTYFAPIDEDEISRLEVMHGVLSRLFDGRLIFPPIRSPRRILDCGCGPGDWAIEVATQYPDAEVLGIDVSPHMIPENPPDNMELQVDDLNGRQVAQPYKDPRAPLQLASWMRSAGFTEVESRLLTLPMCGWSSVPRDYDIGRSNTDNVNQLLYSLALYPFTQFLGMSFSDFQLLIAQARSEASNPAFKAYFPV
ncbi:hypothetical protein HZS61_012908 [Fusarium oxysporum f. sp. conglutinans]|uniref:Methyltransferase domain-containing protein n=1 Tax=Fusarium oxysporum f. sp. conglutinans TaxID=100902 RepID=A0A8H6GUJ1_FUSOX|nr:hypothetical protein HZS61_012908 [Fusarium oxysporum f. sp. conglutinans]